MEITRNRIETGRGPSDWFTGAVYLDTVAVPSKLEVDDAGNPATWGDHVSDEEYAAAAPIDTETR